MTDQRRYAEEEAAEIFRLAAAERELPGHPGGLLPGFTLGDLQAIGVEAGLSPERIAEAAAKLEARRSAPAPRRLLGAPMSVSRSVDLPRALDDREWELLLTDIRETFAAAGRTQSQGALRQWTNGNLNIFVEATEDGYRLRMRTVKGDARSTVAVGVVAIVMSILFLLLYAMSNGLDEGLFLPLVFGATGVATLSFNSLRLHRWAEEREAQMEYLGARALALLQPSDEEP